MKYTVDIGKFDQVKLPVTFRPKVEEVTKGTRSVDVHCGSNLDVVIITAHNAHINSQRLDMIRTLVDVAPAR